MRKDNGKLIYIHYPAKKVKCNITVSGWDWALDEDRMGEIRFSETPEDITKDPENFVVEN